MTAVGPLDEGFGNDVTTTDSFHASAGARLVSSSSHDNPFTETTRVDEEITPSMRDVGLVDDVAAEVQPGTGPGSVPGEIFLLSPPVVPEPTKTSVASSPPASGTSASAVGASYGDLLAPPPSYADSMMYSRPPDGFHDAAGHQLHDAAGQQFHDAGQSGKAPGFGANMSDTGMMNTVALDGGVGGESNRLGYSRGGGGNGGNGGGGSNPSRAGSSGFHSSEIVESPSARGKTGLQITVTDPQMSSTASSPFGKKIVTYKVVCVSSGELSQQQTNSTNSTTWRRFRDFVALADALQLTHKGYFVPPRPEKKPLASSNDDFVRDRTLQLHNYLARLAKHPVLKHSEELRVFLTSQDLDRDPGWARFGLVREPAGVESRAMPGAGYAHESGYAGSSDASSSAMRATSDGGAYGAPPGPYAGHSNPNAFAQNVGGGHSPTGGGVGQFFKTLAQSGAAAASSALGSGKGQVVGEDDFVFTEERDRVFRLEQELAIASLKAGRCLETNEKFGDAMGELGLECVKLAKLEELGAASRGEGNYSQGAVEGRDVGSRIRKMGNAAVRVARLTRSAIGALGLSLNPMHEYLGMMPAVRRAVADRSEALTNLQSRVNDLESKKQRLARLELDITKMLKVDLLKRETVEAERLVALARVTYDTVKSRNADEFVALEKSRAVSFKKMWLAFARTQVAHAEKVLTVWRQVAEDLGASAEEWGTTETIHSPTVTP